MKLALFIPSLEVGGAERQMIMLAKSLMQNGHTVSLWCLRETGAFVAEARDYGIPVLSVDKGGRYDLIGAALRLRKICLQDAPEIIISCLPSANLYGLFARIVGPTIEGRKPRLIWNLASAQLPVGEYGWWAKISYWVQARSARLADKVVVNSVAGSVSARAENYPEDKLMVIHNGVDMERFAFDAAAGRNWRADMGIPPEVRLVGMVGRLDPAKSYEVFLAACSYAVQRDDGVHFVIIGGGDNDYATQIMAQILLHPLFGRRLFHKPSETNMPAAYSALDLMTMTSKSEGLPNTVVEAMACEKPCVVTDVGDCRLAVDRFGKVCEVGDVEGIANAWLSLLAGLDDNQSIARGESHHPDNPVSHKADDFSEIRNYMEQTFSLEKMTSRFESLCLELLTEGRGE